MSNKPVLSDRLSYVTRFYCSLGRSHNTGLTVYVIELIVGQRETFKIRLTNDSLNDVQGKDLTR